MYGIMNSRGNDLEDSVYKCPNFKCSESDDIPENFLCCKISYLDEFKSIIHLGFINALIIVDSEIKIIPQDLHLSNLKILRITNSGLTMLKINDFRYGRYLQELNFTHNKIEQLEPNVFIRAPLIQVIDLSYNRISEVSAYAFENIPELRILILSKNLIQTIGFKSSLIKLEVFMIGNNLVEQLNESVLQESRQLKELCINNNNLTISKLNIDTELEVFDMSNNPTSINLSAKMLKLKNSNAKVLNIDKWAVNIDASNNQIDSIVVDPENNLLELNLSRNNYTAIQNLTVLKSIRVLDLSFNKIQDFTLTSFSHMTELQTLNLENSGLKAIDFGFFSQQKDLLWLDISYNNLNEVNFNMLTPKIESLFIEGNALTNIDVIDVDITLPKLHTLGLANNNFSCTKLVEISKELTAMNISLYVHETHLVKSSRNINGIGCGNDTTTTKIPSIHSYQFAHNSMLETIETRIKEIEKKIVQQNDSSFTAPSINAMVKFISSELKSVQVKVKDLVDFVSVTKLKSPENVNEQNVVQLKQSRDRSDDVITDEHLGYLIAKGSSRSSDELIALKNMTTFIIVAIIFLIFGFVSTIFHKMCNSAARGRYASNNTVNTNMEQSLV